MAEPRLKSKLRVQAMLREAQVHGSFGAVLRPGDADAGGVLVVLRAAHGLSVLSQTTDRDGNPSWMRGTGADPVDQDTADAYVARQIKVDPDVWVVELDAHDLLPPFQAKLVG